MSMQRKDPHLDTPRADDREGADLGGRGPGGGGFGGGSGADGDMHDAFLARALGQAPDRTALPDWQVRQAVLDHAHEAVYAVEELLAASKARTRWWNLRTWWRRQEHDGRGSRTPWAAALATVVIGVLVTMVWQREPTPGARPDSDLQGPPIQQYQKKELPSDSEEADAPAASLAPPPLPPAQPKLAERSPSPEQAQAPAQAPIAEEIAKAPSMEEREFEAAQPLSPSQMQDLAKSQSRIAVTPMPGHDTAGSSGAPAARSSAPTETGPRGAASFGNTSERAEAKAMAKDANVAAAAALGLPPPSASVAPPSAAPSARSAPAAPPVAAAPAAPPPPTGPAVEAPATAPAPNYVSLARWSEVHIASVSGQVRTVQRAEGSSLVSLLSEAAAQQSSGEVLRELPQWRVSLERKGQQLALLEVGRSQLRWTEGAAAPVTSRPPPALIESLNASLRDALKVPAGRARK